MLLNAQRTVARVARSAPVPLQYRFKATTAPLETRSPPPECKKLPQLSSLSQPAYRLAFRSLPYAADKSVVFPSSPLQFTHNTPLFSLRCFPSQRSRPKGLPPRPPRPRTLRVTPIPSLISTTNPNPLAENPFLSTLEDLKRTTTKVNEKKKPYTMDLTIFASKKKVHKNQTVRERCKRRLREAIRLVVSRSAEKASAGSGKEGELRLNEDDVRTFGPRKWLLPGYHYVATITLEVYRAPMEDLVDNMRKALKALRSKVETTTLDLELDKIPIPPPDPVLKEDER